MKKLFLTTLTLLACGAAYALPVGNPSEANMLCDGLFWEGNCCVDFCDIWCDPCANWCDFFAFRGGYYGDFVFDRHLEVNTEGNHNGNLIEDTEIFTNAGYLVLNLVNRLDIFATLGTTNFRLETNAGTFGGTPNSRFELESETHFSWSIGGRLTLWQCGCTTIGFEGQYFRTRPDIERITQGSTLSVYPDETLHMKYWEWQLGLGISHRINMLVPYAAVKWSKAKVSLPNQTITLPSTGTPPPGTVTLRDLESRKHWGWALGVSLVDCEKMSVTVEGRWADEKAVYVNGQIRF